MTESPWGGGETTVTIKYGRGYEESWAVFRGTTDSIRAQIVAYFDPEPETIEGLSLHELVINMTKVAHGSSAASAGLGGTVIQGGKPARGGWAAAAAEPAVPERHPLYAMIEAVVSVDSLKELYARHVDTFKADTELLAAWKAKGSSLKAAA